MTRRIGSEQHELFTLATVKRALSFWEDKRAWIDSNCSLPYGHCRLRRRRLRAWEDWIFCIFYFCFIISIFLLLVSFFIKLECSVNKFILISR
jgi:hypothetical protein